MIWQETQNLTGQAMPNTKLTDPQMLRIILKQTRDPNYRGAIKRAIKNAMVLQNMTAESLHKYGLTKKGMRTPNVKADIKKEWRIKKDV